MNIFKFLNKNKKYITKKTDYGFLFKGPPFLVYENFELDEQRFIVEKFQEFDFVVNIGANVGFYACLALSFGKSVIAFEPIRENFEILVANILANQWQNKCRVFQSAIGEKVDIIQMFGEGTGASKIIGWAGGSSIIHNAPQFPLDDFSGIIANPSLFIVDVEGAEYEMLSGARSILSQDCSHTWLIEISINEHQPAGQAINPLVEKTFSLMESNGYRASFLSGAPISQSQVRDWQAGRNIPSLHNFVFEKCI